MDVPHQLRRFLTSLLLIALLVAPYSMPLTVRAEESSESPGASDSNGDEGSSRDTEEPSSTAEQESFEDSAPPTESTETGKPETVESEPTTNDGIVEPGTLTSEVTPDIVVEEVIEELILPEDIEEFDNNPEDAFKSPDSSGSGSVPSGASVTSVTSTTTQYGPIEVTTVEEAATTTILAPFGEIGTTTAPATTTAPQPTIVSGRAIALANVLNIVNSNFVNSEGVMVFSNFVNPIEETLDFRTGFSEGACGFICYGGDHVSVKVDNDAEIQNAIVLRADTGGNYAEGGDVGTITTGDAYAGLNLINLANTNIIDSNYLLVTMNAFQGIRGDIVFPSFSSFFTSLLSSGPSRATLATTNSADIENLVALEASTGGNSVTGAAASSVTTGSSIGATSVFNQINSTQIGSGNVSVLFRVHGTWAGRLFGAPTDLGWMRSPDGSMFLFDTIEQGRTGGGSVAVEGTNSALIRNDVSVIALTGENAVADSSTALISTGDAYAGANVVNIANTNIVGRNWILAIINIFGDFEGDIAFGRPDLWVGEQVSVPQEIGNGSELEYTFTVINNGDSDSSETRLEETYDTAHIEIIESSLAFTESEPGTLSWELGTLPEGQATEVTYRARVKDAPQGTDITNVVEVRGYETDDNEDDNRDTATVTTYSPSGHRAERKQKPVENQPLLTFEVRRLEATMAIEDGLRTVREEVVVMNDTKHTATNVVVHDLLRAPDGSVIQDEAWDLGTVLPNEEITLAYDITFAANAPLGTYTLSTKVEGRNVKTVEIDNGSIALGKTVNEPLADAEYVEGDVLGMVLSALSTPVANAAEQESDATRSDYSWWLLLLSALLPLAYAANRIRANITS